MRRWQAPVHWTSRRASARFIACESYHEDTYISTRDAVSPDAVESCEAVRYLVGGFGWAVRSPPDEPELLDPLLLDPLVLDPLLLDPLLEEVEPLDPSDDRVVAWRGADPAVDGESVV